MKEKKKILIIQTGFIGDVVLSTPVIDALLKIFPNAEISILTTPISTGLFYEDPRIHEVIAFDKRASHSGTKGFFKILKIIRSRKFNSVFCLHKSIRSSLLVYFSNIKESYGFKQSAGSFLFKKTAERTKSEHDVLRNLSILNGLGVNSSDYSGPLKLNFSELTKVTVLKKLERFQGKKKVVIAPGSVWLTKRWSVNGFINLCLKLMETPYQLVFIGGPSDKEIILEITKGFDPNGEYTDRYLDLVGDLSLLESVAVIDCSDVVVANDSAPLHFSSSRQKPVVSIFCATIPEFGFGPWMTKHKIIQVDGLRCRPCGRHGGNYCPTGTNACRSGDNALEVFNAVLELL